MLVAPMPEFPVHPVPCHCRRDPQVVSRRGGRELVLAEREEVATASLNRAHLAFSRIQPCGRLLDAQHPDGMLSINL